MMPVCLRDVAPELVAAHRVARDVVRDGVVASEVHVARWSADTGLHAFSCSAERSRVGLTQPLFSVWCGARPVSSLAAAALVESEVGDPAVPIGELIEVGSSLAELPFVGVVSHDYDLSAPSIVEANFMPLSVSIDRALSSLPQGPGPKYGDWVPHVISSMVIEALCGEPATRWLNRLVADYVTRGLSFGFDPDPERWTRTIGHYVLGLPDRAIPLLHDRTPAFATERRDLFGGFASASGLAEFYARLGRTLAGDTAAGFPSAGWIAGAGRSAVPVHPGGERFLLGLRVGVLDGRPDSLGHVGLMGSSVGAFDPLSETSIGIVMNGVGRDPERAASARNAIGYSLLASEPAAAGPPVLNGGMP